MSMIHRLLPSAVASMTVALAIGCGDGKPSVDSSNTEATVKGTVKVDGVPIKSGEVTFDASNLQRQIGIKTAPIKDGQYTITTLTGMNIVKLGGDAAKKTPLLQRQSRSIDVKSGENSFDMEFSAK